MIKSVEGVIFSQHLEKIQHWGYREVLKSGADGDRTRDLLHAMQARSQLRHSPQLIEFL